MLQFRGMSGVRVESGRTQSGPNDVLVLHSSGELLQRLRLVEVVRVEVVRDLEQLELWKLVVGTGLFDVLRDVSTSIEPGQTARLKRQ